MLQVASHSYRINWPLPRLATQSLFVELKSIEKVPEVEAILHLVKAQKSDHVIISPR